MRAPFLFALGVIALPAAAEEAAPPAAPDPEFLEFLAEMAGEDEGFTDYLLSSEFDRALGRVSPRRQAAKDEDDES